VHSWALATLYPGGVFGLGEGRYSPSNRAEQSAAADALQLTLVPRFSFRARLSASVRRSKTLCIGNIVMTDTRLLAVLREMLHDRGDDVTFPCIRDLIENALSVSRFSAGAQVPNRQDVTQYLAAWCKRVGLTEDACRGWLIEYCVAMLSSISNSTASRIRHSTKSNVRYVYRSGVSFACGRENNHFKVNCSRECPAYADMKTEFANEISQEANVVHNERPADAVASPGSPVKETYREQFQTAL